MQRYIKKIIYANILCDYYSLNDKTCPYSMGETLYENANQPKSFLQLSGDHCHGLQQETDKYLNYLELFLTVNNIK